MQKNRFSGFTILFVLVGALMLPVTVFSGSLTGTIYDKTDGTSLMNAIVTVSTLGSKSTSVSTPADDNGYYSFNNLDAGLYNLKVSYVGFTAFIDEVTIGESDAQTFDVFLTPTAINLNAISVTASRRPEKIVDAPAAVNMVSSEEITNRTGLSPTEHVKGMPAVDIAQTGLNQSNVVVRGFNNIFSGAMLVLTDNRIARVPSLRFNAHNFIPTVNDDIERIEIVSGPGSALYGPNSANGVMHIITKSPFTAQGGSITLGGGNQDLQMGSFRYAGLLSDNVGIKLSSQYYEGTDWEHFEPAGVEPDSLYLYRPTSTGPDTVSGFISNARNFDVKKLSATGRLDWHIDNNTSLVFNGGFSQNSSIELTGLGAGQAIDWKYYFGQARLSYKDLFVQAFVNTSDAGDTYLLNTGQMIVDKSKLWVAQIQHRYIPSEQVSFTYGIDGLFTRPQTDSTINGRNEELDNINELGAYVQGDYQLSEQVKFVGAVRIDDNDQLEDMVFSPRAGLLISPNADNTFRLTYNKAFTTPDNNNLFLDLLSAKDPYGIGAAFAPTFGFSPNIDIRVQGVPETGFNWSYDANGNPYFRSPFAPLAGMTNEDYIAYNDPTFTNVMWSVGAGATQSGLNAQLGQLVTAGLITAGQQAALMGAVIGVTPGALGGLQNTMMTFNPDTRGFDPTDLSDLADIDRMKPTNTKTIELGYKGVIANKFQFSLDVYRTEKDNFVGPLTVETPNVFLDPAALAAALTTGFGTNYGTTDPITQGTLDMLDNVAFGGNGNGNPVDELVTMFTTGAASIPFGTVTPEEMKNPDAVLVTYRNFGEIDFYGFDAAFAFHLSHHFDIGGTYSYVSKNFFEKNADQVHDIYLNAPQNKFGASIKFTYPKRNITASARFRYVDAFDMKSPFFGLTVDQFEVLDLNFGIDAVENLRVNLTVQNVMDNKHFEFVGAPELGRLAILKGTYSF